jgi:hypothetical protein
MYPPVLLMANPAGKEVVFSNDPSAEYTFITASSTQHRRNQNSIQKKSGIEMDRKLTYIFAGLHRYG